MRESGSSQILIRDEVVSAFKNGQEEEELNLRILVIAKLVAREILKDTT